MNARRIARLLIVLTLGGLLLLSPACSLLSIQRASPSPASPTSQPSAAAPPFPTATSLPAPTASPAPPGEPVLPQEAPYRPFPQHVAYAEGSLKPSQVSQVEMDEAVAQFYDFWKAHYLVQGCGEGRYYVNPGGVGGNMDSDSISVSEGQGYGMLLASFMAGYDPQAQAIFDGLYRFFRDHPSLTSPDLMAWNQVRGCQDAPNGGSSASDGDMDIAFALLLADAQWGSQGAIAYRAEALKVIAAIRERLVNPQTHHIMLGDWVDAEETNYYYASRTSDFMFSHWRAFYEATGDPAWQELIDTTYELVQSLQDGFSPQAGLLPDFIVDIDTTPRPAEPFFLEGETDGEYSYNACRVPWRITLDYLLYGEPRAQATVQRLNAFVYRRTGGDPSQVYAGYPLDGSPNPDYQYFSLAFVAPLGVGAMAGLPGADASFSQAWLDALWDTVVSPPANDGGYYEHSLKLMAMLAMSGGWWGR